jgi:hypothetical protein
MRSETRPTTEGREREGERERERERERETTKVKDWMKALQTKCDEN